MHGHQQDRVLHIQSIGGGPLVFVERIEACQPSNNQECTLLTAVSTTAGGTEYQCRLNAETGATLRIVFARAVSDVAEAQLHCTLKGPDVLGIAFGTEEHPWKLQDFSKSGDAYAKDLACSPVCFDTRSVVVSCCCCCCCLNLVGFIFGNRASSGVAGTQSTYGLRYQS